VPKFELLMHNDELLIIYFWKRTIQ
jgi:hypothetical protein